MGREICISGFSSLTREYANDLPSSVEIWAMNEAHIYLKRRASLWFQIHPRAWNQPAAIENGWPLDIYGRAPGHLERLSKMPEPVMMQEVDERIPSSVKYPLDEIKARYGFEWLPGIMRNYLTSTAAYMFAYALYQHDLYREQHPRGKKGLIKAIHIAGIELAIGTEYFHQRPCVEFWLGMLRGRGVEINLGPTGGTLLVGPVYAVDNVEPLFPKSMTGMEFVLKGAPPLISITEGEEDAAIGL